MGIHTIFASGGGGGIESLRVFNLEICLTLRKAKIVEATTAPEIKAV